MYYRTIFSNINRKISTVLVYKSYDFIPSFSFRYGWAVIIAIIFGCKALSMMETAKAVAASMGIKPSGKLIAVNILGKIGKIAGIALTAFWAFYFTLIFTVFLFM